MYAPGKGIDAIAKQLKDEGGLTPSPVLKKRNTSLLWGGYTIEGILKNRIYIGELTQGKSETKSITDTIRLTKTREEQVIIENHYEPIIDLKLFNSVQELLNSRLK